MEEAFFKVLYCSAEVGEGEKDGDAGGGGGGGVANVVSGSCGLALVVHPQMRERRRKSSSPGKEESIAEVCVGCGP